VVAQHELVGVRMQVHLLVHPLRHRMVVVVISSYKTGHKRQKLPSLTTRILIRKPPDAQ
jgi:hypothetical protein